MWHKDYKLLSNFWNHIEISTPFVLLRSVFAYDATLYCLHITICILCNYYEIDHSRTVSWNELSFSGHTPLDKNITKPLCFSFKPNISYQRDLELSSKAVWCQWVCLSVCLFCLLSPPKKLTIMSWNFEGWFSLGCRHLDLGNRLLENLKNVNSSSNNPPYIDMHSPLWYQLC